jgi:hypothetical protein
MIVVNVLLVKSSERNTLFVSSSYQTPQSKAESMFVDWTGTGSNGDGRGDIYILLKGVCGHGVQRIPVSMHKQLSANVVSDVIIAENVLEDPPRQSQFTCQDDGFSPWTGADMSRDGRIIGLITSGHKSLGEGARTNFFPRRTDESVVSALSSAPCDYMLAKEYGVPNQNKYEALAFINEDGSTLAEISECDGGIDCNVPIQIHDLLY